MAVTERCGHTWQSWIEEEDTDGDATHVCGLEEGHDTYCLCFAHLCWPGARTAAARP